MPSAQQEQGDAIHQAIQENLVIDREGWAHDLVHRAADRLQAGVAAEERLEPLVVWIEEATAFTLPGRYIYVSRRLLQLGLSEEATAFVLAHEMGHHRLGHLREWLTEIPGAWLAGILAKMAHRAFMSPENEAAADRWALERCVAAGYDREPCLTIFDALSRAALDAGDVDGVFGHEDPEELARERLRELDSDAPEAKKQLTAFLATARRWTWQRQRGYASLNERRAALKDVALTRDATLAKDGPTKDAARKAPPGDHHTIDLLAKWEAYLASRGARRKSGLADAPPSRLAPAALAEGGASCEHPRRVPPTNRPSRLLLRARSRLLALGLSVPLSVVGLSACTPSRPPVVAPAAEQDPSEKRLIEASQVEQEGDGSAALAAHLALVDEGLSQGESGVALVLGALDALVWRESLGLIRVGPQHALAYRVSGALATVEQRLGAAHEGKQGHPLSRGFVAEALLDLARFRGDAAAAARWRGQAGVVVRGVGVGPLSPSTQAALDRPTGLESGALKASYEGAGPFAAVRQPRALEADDGVFDLGQISAVPGLHALAFDVEVPAAQRVWISLQSTAGAVLVAGNKVVALRPYNLGGGAVLRAGWVDAPAGALRVVLRLGASDDGTSVALMALGENGAPLASKAPGAGATVEATAAGPFLLADHTRSALVAAAGELAVGDMRGARKRLEALPGARSPLAALLHARALNHADDTPENRRIERSRDDLDTVRKGWPKSWEATLGTALYAAARKGQAEGRVETLKELSDARAEGGVGSVLLRAFESATAQEVGLHDLALAGFADVKAQLDGTPLLAALDARVHPRIGAEAVEFQCAAPGVDRGALGCFQARLRRGDFKGATAEIARLRELRGSPRGLLKQELGVLVSTGDTATLRAFYDALLPGDRALALLGAMPEADAKSRLQRDRAATRDAPSAYAALGRLLGEDPARALEEAGRRAVAEDRGATAPSTAGTLVVLHDERFELSEDGLLLGIIHDVRRVAGTTDVDQGTFGIGFSVLGRDTRKVLRKRIHKRDGRVLEPDRAAQASQGNADLSQLEPGDYVEQIVEGFSLPDRLGQLVVDTSDLLPERTSVKHAQIELRYPKAVKLTRWAHPLLGKAEERDEGGLHVVRYRVTGAAPRRLEEGVARMDREVALSFSTYTWGDVAAALSDLVRSLGDEDPQVGIWARKAVGEGAGPTKETVEKLVIEVGKTVRVGQSGLLTDLSAALLAGPQLQTARYILDLGQGSRSWLLYRALGELKIPAEIVVAEREPFSADPNFPARPNRFDRPLVIAHLPTGDVWIDSDLTGPPLPAGRVSPELRGRVALRLTGEQIPVQGASVEGARDEIDIKLAVDERGDARGTFTIQLRGRAAQSLADALERVVGSDRRDLLRSVVLGWLPWATVDDVTLTSSEGASELGLTASVTIPAYAQGEGKSWVLPGLEPLHSVYPRPSVSTVGATYASRAGRQSALAIESSFQYHVKRRVELPAAAKLQTAPPGVAVKHELLEATRATKVDGRTIEDDFTLSLSTGTVSVTGYDAFAAQAKRLDDAFLAGARVAR